MANKKRFVHSLTHIHQYGEDHYVFYSYEKDHYGEDDFVEKIVKLLGIDYDKEKEEDLQFQFNREAPLLK